MTTTFQVAVDAATARVNSVSCARRASSARDPRSPPGSPGNGVPERRSEAPEGVPNRLRRGRREVTPAGPRDLGAPERALVQEEDLEVPSPAHAAVEAAARRVRDRRVVDEGGDARPVQRLTVLGPREVVDELVIVPVRVERGSRAKRSQRPLLQREPVLPPLLLPCARDRRAADGRVRVDRVAEIDVEVVPLRGHSPVDREAVRRATVLRRSRVRVARDREAHGAHSRSRAARSRTFRRCPPSPAGRRTRIASPAGAPVDPDPDGQVVRRNRAERALEHQPPAGPDLQRDPAWRRSASPHDRRRRSHLAGGDAVPKPRALRVSGDRGDSEHDERGDDGGTTHRTESTAPPPTRGFGAQNRPILRLPR